MPTPTRVTRRLKPGAPGTRKLQLRYGAQLVCVRYRESEDGKTRFTTVELEIERRPSPAAPVRLALDWRESALRGRLCAAGGWWDEQLRCWIAPLRVARRLKLQGRIIPLATDRHPP